MRRLGFAVACMLLGGLLTALAAYGAHLARRPPLHVWHRAALDAEFRAGDGDDLDAYRRREERLFAELREEVNARLEPGEQRLANRFAAASPLNPANHPHDWNRTFELPTAGPPAAGVLALHGLSDSPYSLRALGERLNASGAWVVGLRLPGHGTAPSGLLDAGWRDWTAAVRLAARHVAARVGADGPLVLVGYSNGAALALELAVAALEGEPGVPRVDGLVLISPAVRVTPAAALAGWQAALARRVGVETLAWSDVQPEFDPYKYNSFTLNAAEQIRGLTLSLAGRLGRLAADGDGGRVPLPPVLAFQSVVDATIPAGAVADELLARLAPATGPHELVLFDVNRYAGARALMVGDPEALTGRLTGGAPPGFAVTVVTNAAEDGRAVVARTRPAGGGEALAAPLGLAWPPAVFSLSHVALPFPPDDRVYGARPADGRGITLGSIAPLGERGVLQVPDGFFFRLRYNPFFAYMAERAEGFLAAVVAR